MSTSSIPHLGRPAGPACVDYMNSLLQWIRDTLWPARCVGCAVAGNNLCDTCRHTLPNAPTIRALTDGIRIISGGPIAHPLLAQAIWRMKYRGVHTLAVPLAHWLTDTVATTPETLRLVRPSALIVPVPLHASRFRERGYNQAELLARAIAGIIAMPCAPNTLSRVRHTASQVETADRIGRLENMREAFVCTEPAAVRGRAILLVDDVCTTGATLQDCARALRAAGASSITALTLARG